MSKQPGLSVILPARDAFPLIQLQLEALAGQAGDFEVLVCDNGSSDKTPDAVAQLARQDARFRLILAPERLGAGYARNCAVREARAVKLAFCDADDVVSSSWVHAMTTALEQAQFVTGPLELDRLNVPRVINSRGRWLERNMPTMFDDIFPFASSCNMGLTRRLFDEVGGFNEEFLYGQDVELSLRLWCAGVTLTCVQDALVHYRYRSESRMMWRQGLNHGRAKPHLYKRLAKLSPRSYRRRLDLRSWAYLPRHLMDLLEPDKRGRWLWVAGSKYGHLRGSLSARVVCL